MDVHVGGDGGLGGVVPLPSDLESVTELTSLGWMGDTLSPSELLQLSKSTYAQSPEMPFLMDFPSWIPTDKAEFYLTAAGMLLEHVEHDIISNMLDAWNESIQEIEAQKEEIRKSPSYLAYLELKSTQHLAKEAYVHEVDTGKLEAVRLGYGGLTNRITSAFHEGTLGETAVAAAALVVLAGSVMVDLSTIDIGDSLAGINPISEQAVTPLVNMIPPDFRVEINFFGTMMLAQIMYQTTAEGIAKGGPGVKPLDIDFAKKFAENSMKRVFGSDFESYALAMLSNKLNIVGPISSEYRSQLVSLAKMFVLMGALALVYKVQFGHITGQEIRDMIEGKMDIPEKGIKYKLVAVMQKLLKTLPRQMAESALAAIAEYGDTNPKVEHLLDANHVFHGVLSDAPYEQNYISPRA